VASDLGPLHAATRDLHHAVEQTAHGRAMADGTVSKQAWADWLEALATIHAHVDEWLPKLLRREDELIEDLVKLPPARTLHSIESFVAELWQEEMAVGAGYVLTGAHLMGGKLICARLGNRLPAAHLRWASRKEALDAFAPLRQRVDCVDGAIRCFQTLLAVAEEISDNDA
jgi:heme oxygenase